MLSATLLVGFLGAMLLKGTAYDDFIPFIDPSLTVLLALLASILPIKVIIKNIKEVLLVSPIQTNERIQEALEDIIAEYHFTDYSCHFAKTGRQYDLEINFLVANPNYWSIEQQDALRQVIHNRVVKNLGNTWLTVSFTADKKWL